MTTDSITANTCTRATYRVWRRLAIILLIVAAVGVPINNLAVYLLLLIATVLVFTGQVTARPRLWLLAVVAVTIAVLFRILLTSQPIEEGHNAFLPNGPDRALERGLPSEVYRFMAASFIAQYPPKRDCDPHIHDCWRIGGFPDRPFAFSADAALDRPAFSRRVTGIDFSNPVRLHLGFVNDARYNWTRDSSDLARVTRDRRFWMGLDRWHLTMPWFVMYRFPSDFVGGKLCWRGDVLWEGDGERFAVQSHASEGCRNIEASDVGRRIFGVAIKPESLAMKLAPPWGIRLLHIFQGALTLAAVLAVLAALVRLRPRRIMLASILIALALFAISVDDASFIGGARPFDGGDDGLFYDSIGRAILQQLLVGDIAGALEGGEKVFYYGGPGLRYFRALEHLVFGETYLGYLSLVLLMPVVVFGVFRRFLPNTQAWPLALIFTALPLGEIFGTSFFHYAKWAARGFADPAAHILLLCGLLAIVGARRGGPSPRFGPAAGGALLLALSVFIKPIVAPMVAILLAGAGLVAIAERQWGRLAGMCVGFLPVLAMPLHNWHFGHELVLFSSNARVPSTYTMPPSAYLSALSEILYFEFGGEHVRRALAQIAAWLSGPGQLAVLIPLHAAAVVIVAYVAVRGRNFDGWLRLVAAAALAEHITAMIYLPTPRYFYVMWLLTAVVVVAFLNRVGIGRLRRFRAAGA